MATDISFIIPVHNTSSLLERCFNSIFANKTDFIYELVVVDDASTDDSLQRIQEIELKKPQNCKMEIIHLIENIGVQKARFVGLDKVSSNVVFFLDSDDEIDNTFIEKVVSKMKSEDLDILLINALVITKNDSFTLIGGTSFKRALEYGPYLESLLFGDFGYLWSHVFKTEVLKKVNHQALPHLIFMEDLNYYLEICRDISPKINYLNENLYKYYQEKNWHIEKMNEERAENSIYVIKKRYSEIIERFPEYLELWKHANLNTILRLIHSVKKTKNLSKNDKKRLLNNIYSYDFVKQVINISFKQFMKLSMKDKIRYILYK